MSKWKDVKDLKRKENEWNIFKDWISKTRFYPPLICQVWIKLRHSVWNVYQVNSAQICNTYLILQILLCRVSIYLMTLGYHGLCKNVISRKVSDQYSMKDQIQMNLQLIFWNVRSHYWRLINRDLVCLLLSTTKQIDPSNKISLVSSKHHWNSICSCQCEMTWQVNVRLIKPAYNTLQFT